MNFSEYIQYFDTILSAEVKFAPYDDADKLHYVELNLKRQERWLKKGEILPIANETIAKITSPQNWILIAEPWCGDAAHLVIFIAKMAELNPLINLEIQLRDVDSEINQYLTNGGKSIPILIVRDEEGNDLFRWGPRPKAATQLHMDNVNSNKTVEENKIELQKWYNADKGESVQIEIATLLTSVRF